RHGLLQPPPRAGLLGLLRGPGELGLHGAPHDVPLRDLPVVVVVDGRQRRGDTQALPIPVEQREGPPIAGDVREDELEEAVLDRAHGAPRKVAVFAAMSSAWARRAFRKSTNLARWGSSSSGQLAARASIWASVTPARRAATAEKSTSARRRA